LSELAQNYEEEANRVGSVTVEGRPELPLRNKH
jgi:hypothetical protein